MALEKYFVQSRDTRHLVTLDQAPILLLSVEYHVSFVDCGVSGRGYNIGERERKWKQSPKHTTTIVYLRTYHAYNRDIEVRSNETEAAVCVPRYAKARMSMTKSHMSTRMLRLAFCQVSVNHTNGEKLGYVGQKVRNGATASIG